MRALKPFKPNAVTALKAFKVVQEFERLGERGPALLRRLVSKQKGKRLFRTLDTDFEATFSDFAIIE